MANLLNGWQYRVLALPLLLVYAMDYQISGASRARLYNTIVEFRSAFPIALYVVLSIVAVSVALLALLFAAHWLKPKALKRLSIFLVLYWLPHTMLIGHWCMLDNTSAWIP